MNTCKQCQNSFEVTDQDREFYRKVSPIIKGKTFLVPEPSLCPGCREQRRLSFRNDRYYYARDCDLCNKQIISLYDPKRVKNVYCLNCWWSDDWDPTSYGRDYDFNKPFFEQYQKLLNESPKLAMMNDNGVQSTNCEYTTDFAFGKNCYLVLSSWYDEDCMYGFQTNHSKNCVDTTCVNYSELMYESIACENCYGCQNCQQCSECSDCILCFDLKNCSDCIMSAGLRNKKYCILNVQYSKEEYFERKKKLGLDSWSQREKYAKEFAKFILKTPRKFANLINCEDSTGDTLVRSKNSQNCFYFSDLRDCKFMANGDKAKDSYDCNSTGGAELCYDCITPDNSYKELFSVNCWKSQFISYSDNCHSSQNLFGCANMKRKKYCILNKQYTEEEYDDLLPQIIEHMQETGEWGNFPEPFVTLFAYNESAAQEWYPITKEQAQNKGYTWFENVGNDLKKATISWEEVPDSITESDQIKVTEEIFACTDCSKKYRITEQELQFYKDNKIPLPRRCANCRHLKRKALMNPKKLWKRECMKCGKDIQTTYAPERQERVLCEECYFQEIY